MIAAIIPARSGSKSVPNKNMRLVKGKPLLAYAVLAAVQSKKIDMVYVSSDSPDYIQTAMSWGNSVENMGKNKVEGIDRPAALSEDVPTEDVILHALRYIEREGYKVNPLVTLQCTTPLMSAADIDVALSLYVKLGIYNSVVSVTEVREYPDWMFQMDAAGQLVPWTGKTIRGDLGVRQTLPKLYRPNGAIHITEVKALREQKSIFASPVGGYVMPWERSLDVDEESDLKLVEALA